MRWIVALIVSLWAGAAAAQRPATPKPMPAAPQQTTATFEEWTMRCAQPTGAAKNCEVVHVVQQAGKPVAELAIGVPGKGRATAMTVLVPANVSFGAAATLLPPDGDGLMASLLWQRCVPGGCLAAAEIGEDVLTRMRGWAQPGRLAFANAAGQVVTLTVPSTGLTQALDALAKENPS